MGLFAHFTHTPKTVAYETYISEVGNTGDTGMSAAVSSDDDFQATPYVVTPNPNLGRLAPRRETKRKATAWGKHPSRKCAFCIP